MASDQVMPDVPTDVPTDSTSPARPAPFGRTNIVHRALLVLGCVMTVILVAQIFVHAMARWLFNHPFIATTDLVRSWWMPILCFVGFVVAEQTREHISVDLAKQLVTQGGRRLLGGVRGLATVVFVGVAGYFGLVEALELRERGEYASTSNVSTWPPTFVVPIALALLGAIAMASAWRVVRSRGGVDAED